MASSSEGAGKKPCVLWLHTQPEHYFNCMMDELAGGSDLEYVAAFSYKGTGVYKDKPLPTVAKSVILKPRQGMPDRPPAFFEKYHDDWRREVWPFDPQAVIISGYGSRTHRELLGACKARGIPVAVWSDSNLRTQAGRSLKKRVKRRLKKWWLRRVVGKADFLLSANSRGLAYWRYFGARKPQQVLVPCYADYPAVERARRTSRAEVLEKAGLPAEARYLYMASNMTLIKGVDLAVAAFVHGGLGNKGWHFVVAGKGPLDGELKAMAGEELGKSVHFVGFQQPAQNTAFMHHADLFLLTSRYEAHGIVVGESLAAETPVLVSAVVGIAPDLVKRGVSGEVFKTGDEGDLIAKLNGLLADRERLVAMRAGARQTFEDWFARTSPIRGVDALARRMLAMRARKGGIT